MSGMVKASPQEEGTSTDTTLAKRSGMPRAATGRAPDSKPVKPFSTFAVDDIELQFEKQKKAKRAAEWKAKQAAFAEREAEKKAAKKEERRRFGRACRLTAMSREMMPSCQDLYKGGLTGRNPPHAVRFP